MRKFQPYWIVLSFFMLFKIIIIFYTTDVQFILVTKVENYKIVDNLYLNFIRK